MSQENALRIFTILGTTLTLAWIPIALIAGIFAGDPEHSATIVKLLMVFVFLPGVTCIAIASECERKKELNRSGQ